MVDELKDILIIDLKHGTIFKNIPKFANKSLELNDWKQIRLICFIEKNFTQSILNSPLIMRDQFLSYLFDLIISIAPDKVYLAQKGGILKHEAL